MKITELFNQNLKKSIGKENRLNLNGKSSAKVYASKLGAVLLLATAVLYLITPLRVQQSLDRPSEINSESTDSGLSHGVYGDIDVKFFGEGPFTISQIATKSGVVNWNRIQLNKDWMVSQEGSLKSNTVDAEFRLSNQYLRNLSFEIKGPKSTRVEIGIADAEKVILIPKSETVPVFFNPASKWISTTHFILGDINLQNSNVTSVLHGQQILKYEKTSTNSIEIKSFELIKDYFGLFLKTVYWMLALFAIAIAFLLIGLQCSGRLSSLKTQKQSTNDLILGFLIFSGVIGALNYFVNGRTSLRITTFLIVGISTYHFILLKRTHKLRATEEKFLKTVKSFFNGIVFLPLGVFIFVSVQNNWWNIGLLQTDSNGYFFQNGNSLRNSYLFAQASEFAGNFTGNGMRSYDASYRMIFSYLTNWNTGLVLSGIFAIMLLGLLMNELLEKHIKTPYRHLTILSTIFSGALTGLWMEAYLTRWFGAVMAMISICLTLLFLDKIEVDYSLLTSILLINALQISINPTFFVVPFISVLFTLIKFKNLTKIVVFPFQKLVNDEERRHKNLFVRIASTVSLLFFVNFLWFRKYEVAIGFANNGVLDGIAKWVVIPFYSTWLFPFQSAGLIPWHNNPGSIFGLSDSFFDVFLRRITGQGFVQTELIKIRLSSVGILVLLTAIILSIRTLKIKKSISENIQPMINYLYYTIVFSLLYAIGAFILTPSRLYVNSMTLISNMPAVILCLTLMFSLVFGTYKMRKKVEKTEFRRNLISKSLAILLLFTSVNGVTSYLEISRLSSGFDGKNGFTYNLLADDVTTMLNSLEEANVKYVYINNQNLSGDYDNYIAENLIAKGLLTYGIDCRNCINRDSKVEIVKINNESASNILSIFSKCEKPLTINPVYSFCLRSEKHKTTGTP